MIINSKLNTTIKKWLACYLRGREQRNSYEGVLSKSTVLKTGVPQGSVLSPILFAWYLQDIPQPPAGVEIIISADDLTILCQNTNISTAALMINNYLETLAPYLKFKQLYFSTTKCAAMLFRTWNAEWKTELNIGMEGAKIPTERNIMLLGVHSITFGEHAKILNNTASNRNNSIRAITSRKTGTQGEESHNCVQSDHSLRPQLCLTSLGSKPRRNPLKEIGSKTERRIENHHRVHKNDSNRPPLTRDTLPAVKTHNKILASQFPADMKNPDHPCHELKANNEERRTIRKSLKNHLKTAQTTLDITEGEATRENLHKAYVIYTIVNLQPNRVLNTQ